MNGQDDSPDVVFAVADPRSEPARRAVERYFAELVDRFEEGFDASVYARGGAGDGPESPPEVFVLGSRGLEPVACGAVMSIGPGIAEFKRMWVERSERGRGLGRRLLATLEQTARERGFHTVRLDTNRVLTSAIALYERSGYERIARYNDNPYAHVWFEKRLDRIRPG